MEEPDIQRYEVYYTKQALKGLNKLDNENRRRVITKIEEEFILNPKLYAETLNVVVYSRSAGYKWRIGKIRVLFDIEGTNLIIKRIAFRKGVYS